MDSEVQSIIKDVISEEWPTEFILEFNLADWESREQRDLALKTAFMNFLLDACIIDEPAVQLLRVALNGANWVDIGMYVDGHINANIFAGYAKEVMMDTITLVEFKGLTSTGNLIQWFPTT